MHLFLCIHFDKLSLSRLSSLHFASPICCSITDHGTMYALWFINFITYNVIFNSILTSLSSLQKSSNLSIALASVRRAAINRTGCSYRDFHIALALLFSLSPSLSLPFRRCCSKCLLAAYLPALISCKVKFCRISSADTNFRQSIILLEGIEAGNLL